MADEKLLICIKLVIMFSIPLFVAEWHTSFRLHKVVGEANLSKALLAHISEFVPAHD